MVFNLLVLESLVKKSTLAGSKVDAVACSFTGFDARGLWRRETELKINCLQPMVGCWVGRGRVGGGGELRIVTKSRTVTTLFRIF